MRELKNLQRERKVISLGDAKTVGILYNASEKADFETVRAFVKKLLSEKKEVTSLGFVDKKELAENQFSKLGLDFFSRKDLSFYMIPKNILVNNFSKGDFDILINLNVENCFPLQYISGISKAKFRVGRYDPANTHFYDLMIKTTEHESLQHFIEQVDHYLTLIKTKNES